MSSNPTPHSPLTTNPEHSDIAIRVQNLSKSYQIYNHPEDWLKQSINPYSHDYNVWWVKRLKCAFVSSGHL